MSSSHESKFPDKPLGNENDRKKFEALLKKKNLKFTYERKYIFEEISRLKGHFDADSLYERFKEKGLRIARDTVYRTLPLLLESGVLQKSAGEGKREYFERISSKGHHDHMICIKTGRIIEFHCDEIERLQEEIARKYGFKIIFHDHRIFGLSKEAQEQE
ncbi:MAG: transcriptional repressor [Candidatus Omnitrophica bacterium]|nr:transcriptional repressor [Candidatus Omnitrophota bacterium]